MLNKYDNNIRVGETYQINRGKKYYWAKVVSFTATKVSVLPIRQKFISNTEEYPQGVYVPVFDHYICEALIHVAPKNVMLEVNESIGFDRLPYVEYMFGVYSEKYMCSHYDD